MDPLVVLVTTSGGDEASRLAHALVEERLAACVSVIPGIQSVYRWQGQVERAAEWLLVIKTVRARLAEVVARVRSLHTYTVPEILALPVAGGSEPYLSWLVAQVDPESSVPHSEP
jgi:periplasmic divalent cation tolerance protein